MKKIFGFVIMLSLVFGLFTGCDTALTKGQKLPHSDADYVWEKLYKGKDLEGQRIALEGYISLQNWRERGDENHCELVDKNGTHLMYIIIKRDRKNSLKIAKKEKAQELNNIEYIEFDEARSAILDNEGNEIRLNEEIVLSFDIKYTKHKDTGVYPQQEVTEQDIERNVTLMGKVAKKGDKYYLFYAENIRIDKI